MRLLQEDKVGKGKKYGYTGDTAEESTFYIYHNKRSVKINMPGTNFPRRRAVNYSLFHVWSQNAKVSKREIIWKKSS